MPTPFFVDQFGEPDAMKRAPEAPMQEETPEETWQRVCREAAAEALKASTK